MEKEIRRIEEQIQLLIKDREEKWSEAFDDDGCFVYSFGDPRYSECR